MVSSIEIVVVLLYFKKSKKECMSRAVQREKGEGDSGLPEVYG